MSTPDVARGARTGTTDPLDAGLGWLERGLRVALATVVGTWGSSPRRPGSMMCVNERGEFAGSVSGGCVETAVVEEALGALENGTPRRLEYGVADEDAWEVGLACGGSVEVYLEVVGDARLLELLSPPADRRAARVVTTDLESGARTVFVREAGADGTVTVTPETPESSGAFDDETAVSGDQAALRDAVRAALAADRSEVVELAGRRIFLHVVNPPVRVVVVGAVHIAQALVPMIRAVGHEVVVVDPRTAFASPERFGDVRLLHAWPDDAFEQLGLDPRTAVVALTHDPKLDDPALVAALSSEAFYVGALGSSRTHARRLERLGESGVAEDRLRRIHAPIGLDIGARTPGEIAAAVLAEVVQSLRAGSR